MLVAKGSVFLKRLGDNCVEGSGYFWVQAAGCDWPLIQDGIHRQHVILAYERSSAGCRFVKHNAQGKQIAASIDLLSRDLLGRHVGSCAGNSAFHGERLIVVAGLDFRSMLRDGLGQSKIQNLHPTRTYHENICGLYVSMDDPLR